MNSAVQYLLAVLLSISFSLCSATCPQECRCTGTTVVCSDLGLHYVPRRIPLETEKL